jgi:PDDEXK-like uncharacterized protein DUF3799
VWAEAVAAQGGGVINPAPIRFSHLKAYGRSAMHGHHARTEEAEQTVAMQRGTATHALLFGNRRVLGYPGAVRRGKEYDAFVTDNPDAEILTGAEFEKAQAMADSVRASALAMKYLDGEYEKTLLFKWYGQDCRVTPDCRGHRWVTELKTTADANPERFQWHALRMHYHAQLAYQMIAAKEAEAAFLVVVESAPPFPVTVMQVTERALVVGDKLLAMWMETLINCEKSDTYPPYCESLTYLDIPDDEVEIDYGEEAA